MPRPPGSTDAAMQDGAGAVPVPRKPSGDRDAGGSSTGPAADIPGFVVLGELGRGSQASVHRVRRTGTAPVDDREYALKLMTVPPHEAPRATLAFRREAAQLAGVGHPGLPRIHEVGEVDGRAYLVMDLIEGASLADALLAGPMPAERVARLAIDLADPLAAVHRSGLLHRDVKPDNILVQSGRARLIDFGLAARESGEREDVVAGTLLYCAPEQTGMLKRPVDQRSDLYSLGVVLYECLAGHPPLRSDDVGELLRLHACAPVPDLAAAAPGTPAALVAVVTRLLAKDPDDRYPDGAALLADLRVVAAQPGIAPGGTGAGTDAGNDETRQVLGGRDHEWGVLRQRWTRAHAGAGGVALVRGAGGSGKSRLVAEMAAEAHRAGALVLRGKCSADDSLPLAPLRAAVEGHLRALTGLPEADRQAGEHLLRAVAGPAGPLLAGLSPALASFLGQERSTATDQDRYLLAVTGLFADLAQRCGQLVFVLDDVQWLDDGSRRVLGQLCRTLPGLPMLVLATARDDADSRDAVAEVVDVCGPCLDTDLTLSPLDDDGVAQMIATLLTGHAVDPALARQLTVRSGGSPFVVGEYVRAVVDAGLLRPSWGHWVLDDGALDALDLPHDALGLVLARLQGLTEAARRILSTAATVGTRFRCDVVAAVEDLPPDDVLAALALAADHHLIEVRPRDEFAFVHDRIREALLEALDEDMRAALHARIAAALERLPAADGLRAERVYAAAHHHMRSAGRSPVTAAFAACESAGRLALADFAVAEAVTFLDYAASFDLPLSSDFLLTLGTALARQGTYDAAGQRLEEALQAETDPHRRALIHAAVVDMNRSAWRVETARIAVDAGLAELGVHRHPSRAGLVANAIGALVLALVMQWTGIGLGSARGALRERADLIAHLHYGGVYVAANDLRPGRVLLHSVYTLYHGNRLGSGVSFCRGQRSLGFTLGMLGLARAGDRAFERVRADPAGRNAAEVALTVHTGGAYRYFSGGDDGQDWAANLEARGHLLDPGAAGEVILSLLLDAISYGRRPDVTAWCESGAARFGPRLSDAHGVRELVPAADAVAGRPVDTRALVDRIATADFDDLDRLPILRIQVWTALLVMDQFQEWGPEFDHVVKAYEAMCLTPARTLRFMRFAPYTVALGRLAQWRAATDDTRPARLSTAGLAVRELRRYAVDEHARIGYAVCRADLLIAQGRPSKAMRVIEGIPAVPRVDAPRLALEIARVRARALLAMGGTVQAARQATVALAVAEANGWHHKARAVRAEFGLVAAAGTSGHHRSTHGTTLDRSTQLGAMTATGSGLERTRLRALEQVSAAAASVLDPGKLARICLDETIRILAADRALLFLVEGEGERARLAPHLGRDAAGADVVDITGYSATVVDRAWRSGQPLVLTGTEEGEALGAASVVLHGLRSILVAPLQVEGRALGVVYVDSQVAKGIFSDDDASILMALNNHVATSLETARAAQLEISVRTARQQRDLASGLRESLELMSQTLDPDTVLQRLLEAALRVLPAERATIAPPGSAVTPEPAGMRITVALRDGGHDLGTLVLTSDAAGTALPESVEVAEALVSQAMMAYRNAHLFAQVEALAVTDELTGVANRRHFFELAGRDVTAAQRHCRPALALMVDIDHFKRVNDAYGHPVGDDVIQGVAGRLAEVIGGTDILGRYGGEEFALLLPDADSCSDLPARLCGAISATPIPTRAGPLPVSVSIGVARLEQDDADISALLARADRALYQAKETGRNRVVQI